MRERGLAGRPDLPAPRIYCSEHAHSSVDKAVMTLGLGHHGLRRIATDERFRMRPDALAAAIEDDRRKGMTPLAVVATVGTTAVTSVDPVPAIADVCAGEGLWLHVDAAYAGAAAMVPGHEETLAGCDRADSLVVNPHKWLFIPFDLSALYCRRMDRLEEAFALTPDYLQSREPGAARNLMDTGVQLGRRFRALKLWMVLRYFGADGIRRRLAEHMRLARLFAEWVDADGRFERLAPAPFSVVCFRANPAEPAGDLGRPERAAPRRRERHRRGVPVAHAPRRPLRPCGWPSGTSAPRSATSAGRGSSCRSTSTGFIRARGRPDGPRRARPGSRPARVAQRCFLKGRPRDGRARSGPLMERRVLLAFLLSLLVLLVYQSLVVPPPAPGPPRDAAEADAAAAPSPAPAARPDPPRARSAAPAAPDTDAMENGAADSAITPVVADEELRDIVFESERVLALFRNRGGSPVSWELRDHLVQETGQPIDLVPRELPARGTSAVLAGLRRSGVDRSRRGGAVSAERLPRLAGGPCGDAGVRIRGLLRLSCQQGVRVRAEC